MSNTKDDDINYSEMMFGKIIGATIELIGENIEDVVSDTISDIKCMDNPPKVRIKYIRKARR